MSDDRHILNIPPAQDNVISGGSRSAGDLLRVLPKRGVEPQRPAGPTWSPETGAGPHTSGATWFPNQRLQPGIATPQHGGMPPAVVFVTVAVFALGVFCILLSVTCGQLLIDGDPRWTIGFLSGFILSHGLDMGPYVIFGPAALLGVLGLVAGRALLSGRPRALRINFFLASLMSLCGFALIFFCLQDGMRSAPRIQLLRQAAMMCVLAAGLRSYLASAEVRAWFFPDSANVGERGKPLGLELLLLGAWFALAWHAGPTLLTWYHSLSSLDFFSFVSRGPYIIFSFVASCFLYPAAPLAVILALKPDMRFLQLAFLAVFVYCVATWVYPIRLFQMYPDAWQRLLGVSRWVLIVRLAASTFFVFYLIVSRQARDWFGGSS